MVGWLILIAMGVAIGWTINARRVEDHTGDPDALPCPVCRTASPMKTLGFHVCPQCSSRWLPEGSWVVRFRCGCGAAPNHITQDYYNPTLFGLTFSCGRHGSYNDDTGGKHDWKPCGKALREKIAETETWSTVEEVEKPSAPTTKVDPNRPDWVVDDDGVCTQCNDYEGETEVIIE